MKNYLLAAAALGVLASCNKEEPKKGPQSAEDVAKELSAMKMEPGRWEATPEILSASAPGMPEAALKEMIGQKSTVTNCVTPEQAARPSANFLAAQKNSDCTYQDFSMDDGKMTGTMTCSGGTVPGKMVMKINGRYDPRSYDMNMEMNASGMPGGMTMALKAKTTGRRVGDCAPGEGSGEAAR
jgi:hypothetical protein